jgi:hypothetical protein
MRKAEAREYEKHAQLHDTSHTHALSLLKEKQTVQYCTLFPTLMKYTAAYERPTPKAAKPSYVFPITRLPTPTQNVVA